MIKIYFTYNQQLKCSPYVFIGKLALMGWGHINALIQAITNTLVCLMFYSVFTQHFYLNAILFSKQIGFIKKDFQ